MTIIECGKFGVMFKVRSFDGFTESRPIVLCICHAQHDPALVFCRVHISDRIGHGFALRTHGILFGDETTGDIESEYPCSRVVKGYFHFLCDPCSFPDKKRAHNAGK